MNSNEIDYADVLTYLIQDMGNSLGIISSSLERVKNIEFDSDENTPSLFDLLYETSRANTELVRIYQLYQIDHNNYQLQLDDHCVYDIIEEEVVRNDYLINTKNIQIDIECDEDLTWAFDEQLIRGAISSIMVGVLRYARDNILIKVDEHDSLLRVSIADDSNGYPPSFLVKADDCAKGLTLRRESVDLGVYYALRVAQLHCNESKKGFITINNDCPLGGGCFTLHIT